jgi:hypothetical protein
VLSEKYFRSLVEQSFGFFHAKLIPLFAFVSIFQGDEYFSPLILALGQDYDG